LKVYLKKHDPESGQEKLVPVYYEKKYDPELGQFRLEPNDNKWVFVPLKGHDVLIGGTYTSIRDELGNEVARLKNTDLTESLTIP
jgi:hypothetical protein